MATHLANASICIAGAIIPGLGHALKGRWGQAILFQIAVFGVVILLCLTRLVVAPLGLEIMLALVALIHGASAISAVSVAVAPFSKIRRGTLSAGLLGCSLVLAVGLFIGKASLLGVNLYYIPSASMYPTLKPGDFIVVDTWAYRGSAPEINDIVTFMLPNKPGHVMVKRIAGTEVAGASYTLLGDNPHDSQDSRQFGAIKASDITGKVIHILSRNLNYPLD